MKTSKVKKQKMSKVEILYLVLIIAGIFAFVYGMGHSTFITNKY